MKQKKLYTDLDGTWITTKSGKPFPIDNDDWAFIPNVLSSMVNFCIEKQIKDVIIVTNQGGIDEGYQRPIDVMDKIHYIRKNIEAYFELHKLNVHFKVNMAPSMTSINRKPFILANYIQKFETLDQAKISHPEATFIEDDTHYHFEDKESQKKYRLLLGEYLGYMVGNASGIQKLEKVDPDNSLKSKARKSWGNGEITFVHRGKNYSISHVSKQDADMILHQTPLHAEDTPEPLYLGVFHSRQDHSDSDLIFAKINNLEYFDIEDFINQWK